MSWVRLDDQFVDHPKVVSAGSVAGWLYIAGLCYCQRHLTDGFIPGPIVGRLTDLAEPANLSARLVEVGLWEVVDGGYLVHDFLEFNEHSSKVKEQRRINKDRQDRWREKRRNALRDRLANQNGDAPVTPLRTPSQTASRDALVTGAPSHPIPSTPLFPTEIDNNILSPSERVPTPTPQKWRPSKRVPPDWQPTLEHSTIAKDLSVDLKAELEKFRDYEFGKARKDWDATFRNWLRKAAEMAPRAGPHRPAPQPYIPKIDFEAEQRIAAERKRQWGKS